MELSKGTPQHVLNLGVCVCVCVCVCGCVREYVSESESAPSGHGGGVGGGGYGVGWGRQDGQAYTLLGSLCALMLLQQGHSRYPHPTLSVASWLSPSLLFLPFPSRKLHNSSPLLIPEASLDPFPLPLLTHPCTHFQHACPLRASHIAAPVLQKAILRFTNPLFFTWGSVTLTFSPPPAL